MRKILLFAILNMSLVYGQSVSKVAFSGSKGTLVRAFSPSGEITLQRSSVQLDIVHAAGSRERGNLVVVYDPKSGYFYWHLNPVRDASDSTSLSASLEAGSDAIYVSPSGILEFGMPGDLGVVERTQRAVSLDAAEDAAIEEITKGLSVFEKNGYDPGFRQVELGRQIGSQWACPGGDAPDFDPLCSFHIRKFVSISREGENWRIVARNRWDQEIILDSKFNFVSTRPLLAH